MNDPAETPRHVKPWIPVDPLGEALHTMRMNGVFYTRSEFTAPWGLELPPMPGVLMFHVVTSGRCWLEIDGSEPRPLRLGDLALVPHGEGHRLVSEPGTPSDDLFDLPREQLSDRYEILRAGSGGEPTNMICGAVRFDHPSARELLGLLPKTIAVEAWSSPHGEWIQSTLRLMAAEARELRPGGETIITRLADILVIQIIRSWIDDNPNAGHGWLHAMRDPQVGGAILLMHRSPSRPWTVASLAAEVAMSRSAFSARFKTYVGESPLQYLTRWRMNVAAIRLEESDIGIPELAEDLGYRSEAAFSRAFKRVNGIPPGAARRRSS